MNFIVSKYQLELPGEWQEVDKTAISKDLPGVAGYWKQQTETYLLQLVIQEVPAEHIDYLQPFDVDTVVKRAHEQMDETRGLIEVSVVKTASGRELLRTILKESLNHLPMYVARLQHKNDDGSGFVVQLISKEVGMTGLRESMILASNLPQEMLKTTDSNTGETITQGAPIPNWAADPYDPSYKKGFLMNKSENTMFDQQFPNHPLSVLRADLESIQSSLTEKQDSQASLTQEEAAALQAYTSTGLPSAAPTTPFVPSDDQRSKLQPIKSPRTVPVNWLFDGKERKKFEYGHKAQEMEDKWDIYLEDDVVHFHRSWTGNEIFRFKLSGTHGLQASTDREPVYTFRVASFEVEQDPEIYKETDEQAMKDMLGKVLRFVLGVSPISTAEKQVE